MELVKFIMVIMLCVINAALPMAIVNYVIQSSWDVFYCVRASRASVRALLALVLVAVTFITVIVSSVLYLVLCLWTHDEDTATLTAKGITTLVLVYMSTRLRKHTATTTAQGNRASVVRAIIKGLEDIWTYIKTYDQSPASVDKAPPAPAEPAAPPDSPVGKQPPDTPTTVSTAASSPSPPSSSSSSPPPPSPPSRLDASVRAIGMSNASIREVVAHCLGGVIAEVERRVPSADTLTTPSTRSPSLSSPSPSSSSPSPSPPSPPSPVAASVRTIGMSNAGTRQVVEQRLGGVIAEVERRVSSADTLTTTSIPSPPSSSPPSSSSPSSSLDTHVNDMGLLSKASIGSVVKHLFKPLIAQFERRATNGVLQDRDGSSPDSLTPEANMSESPQSVVVAPPASPESSSPVGNPPENTTLTTTSTTPSSPSAPPSPLEDATASETGVMLKASIRRVLEAHVKELAAKVALRAPVMHGTEGSSPVSFTPETKVAEVDPSDPLPSPLSMSPPASSPPQSPSDDIGRWIEESILDPIIDNAAWIGEVVATPTDGSVATEAVPAEDASQKATDAQLHVDMTSSSSSSSSSPSSTPPRRAHSPVHVTPSPPRSSEGIVRALQDLDITPDGPRVDDTNMSEDHVNRDDNTQTPPTTPPPSSPFVTSPQTRRNDDMHTPTSEPAGARAVRFLDMDFVAEGDVSENTTPVPADNHDTTSLRPSRIFEPAPATAGSPLTASVCRPKPAAQARHRYTPTYDANNMRVNRASCLLRANTQKKLNKAVSESGGATPLSAVCVCVHLFVCPSLCLSCWCFTGRGTRTPASTTPHLSWKPPWSTRPLGPQVPTSPTPSASRRPYSSTGPWALPRP